MKEFLNSFEIFSGWGGGLVAWVVVGADILYNLPLQEHWGILQTFC
jgi:hypothetical protein